MAGFALRFVVLVVPVAVSVAVSFVVTRVVPPPAASGPRVVWFALVIVGCGLLAFPARRVLRRLLPLAALLELSIRFPGTAPTRWKVAREASSIRHLELLATGLPDSEPVRAATTILALVASLSRHDRVTRGHSERVRVFTNMIGREMALSRGERDRLHWAALIHDIGKLEVPGRVLRKPGRPTPEEWESLKLHPQVGARLAAPLDGWLGAFASVVVQHHERFDGTGYPAGLRGDEISIGGRIVGLADAFEVMTAARPYKKAMSRVAALREVVNCSGTHFDPAVVRAFLEVSTPRLRRALGPASWIGQLPVVATAPAAGIPSVAGVLVRGAGTAVVTGLTGAVVASGLTAAAASASPAPAASDAGIAHHDVTSPAAADAVTQPAAPGSGTTASPVAPNDGGPGGQLAGRSPAVNPGSAAPAASPGASKVPGTGGSPGPGHPASGTPSSAAGAVQQVAGTLVGTVNGVVAPVVGTVKGVVAPVVGTVNQVTGVAGTTVGSGVQTLIGAAPTPAPTPAPQPSPKPRGGLLGKLLG